MNSRRGESVHYAIRMRRELTLQVRTPPILGASCRSRLLRTTADRYLQILRERLRAQITLPEVRVRSAWVFGSYLGEREKLGDLDIAIDYEIALPRSLGYRAHFAAEADGLRKLLNGMRLVRLHPHDDLMVLSRIVGRAVPRRRLYGK
jgi:predicted nucleotidyltransferase